MKLPITLTLIIVLNFFAITILGIGEWHTGVLTCISLAISSIFIYISKTRKDGALKVIGFYWMSIALVIRYLLAFFIPLYLKDNIALLLFIFILCTELVFLMGSEELEKLTKHSGSSS